MMKCVSCKFFEGGVCRRYPPVLTLWPSGNQQPIVYIPLESWPTVKANDWCGEYKNV